MRKRAFTMLELVFVIVVLGVLAAAIIPRMDRDSVYEAAEQVLSHIKYTQQLAMSDNVYRDQTENWHYARWHINFMETGCGILYKVGSNRDLSGVPPTYHFSVSEAASDPLTKKALYSQTLNCAGENDWQNDLYLTDKYGINNNDFSITCSTTKTIAFDHLGRPYFGFTLNEPTNKLLKNDCNITMQDSMGNSATITITPETGYSYITYN